MNNRWTRLVADPQVVIDNPSDPHFKRFVEEILPELVKGIQDELVTPNSLMHAQYLVMQRLAAVKGYGEEAIYKKMLADLALFPHACKALSLAKKTDEDFYKLVPGFNDSEIRRIKNGSLTIRDVMDQRPAVILRPMLQRNKH